MRLIKAPPALVTKLARPAVRDALVILVLFALAMAALAETEASHLLFRWISANPETEADALILAGMLSTLGMLVFSVRRYRELQREVKLRTSAEGTAVELAYRDMLTGLPNRRAFSERLTNLASAKRVNGSEALLIVDLDGFKSVNDSHGHLAGDRVLQQVAFRLSGIIGREACVFRLGGDEFALLAPAGLCSLTPQEIAEQVIAVVGDPIIDAGLVHHIGASVGIAALPHDTNDVGSLLRYADIALYQAKAAGRGQYMVFEPAMAADVMRGDFIERQMREAVGSGAFRPFFQPIVVLDSGDVVGYEMLMRWERREQDEIPPEQFIPVAEETGLIAELLMEVLEQALRQTREWPARLWISINLSPVQFKDPWISQKILGCLARTGFPACRLIIEITENALIANAENARQIVESLRNQGIRLALDDFGTGHSSLHHLRLLPFDKLKIDRSYVQAITRDQEALNLVGGIVSLAQHLGLVVVAEGVETAEVAEALKAIGCHEAQGWLFGRAVPADQIAGRKDSLQLGLTA